MVGVSERRGNPMAILGFVIGVAIAIAVGFVIFLLDSDGGKRTRRRRSSPYRRRSPRRRGRQW